MELWSLLSITAPGLFPDPSRFREYYARPIERQGDAGLLAQLRRRIRPLVKRRTKEQVAADLPDKQEQVLEVDLHPRPRGRPLTDQQWQTRANDLAGEAAAERETPTWQLLAVVDLPDDFHGLRWRIEVGKETDGGITSAL